jgi:DNA modification methylase
MKEIPVTQLIANELTYSLYGQDETFDRFLMSIELFGILEPLKVYEVVPNESYQVVSGNRRLSAAKALSIKEVPCILCEPMVLSQDLVRAHQEQRIKKRSELLLEVKSLYSRYGDFLKKGTTKVTEEVRKARQFRDALEKESGGKHIIQQLRIFEETAKKISNGDEEKYKSEIDELNRSKSLSGVLKSQEKRLFSKLNKQARETYEFEVISNAEVRSTSSKSLNGIKSGSVKLCFTSPCYFKLRFYNNGEEEMGQEPSVKEYAMNLASHFDECKRVLTDDGTLWVNIMDTVIDYQFQLAPELFVLEMVNRGWMLHDKQIWLKKNPTWNDTSRSVTAHEYLYVFKKCSFVQFDDSWVKDFVNDEYGFTYGNSGNRVKLRSIIDYRDGVVVLPIANNTKLSKKCAEQGIRLTHSATFPVTLPLIAIMSCTKPGDLILDCFSGTGTTGEAVLRVGGGRRYIGYEINEEYQMQANVRLKETVRDLESQGIAA